MMSKTERIKAALKGEQVDRPPVSLWMHYPEVDQNPVKLARAHVDFQEKNDLDFIKLTPSEYYCVEDWGCRLASGTKDTELTVVRRYGVESSDGWLKVQALKPEGNAWGREIMAARCLGAMLNPDVPFVPTVYSPLTVARKLAGDRLLQDLREYPRPVHRALEQITATTIEFVRENLTAGAAGIFLATACANHTYLAVKEYEEFGRRYDLEVMKAASRGWFNILHIHGRSIMYDELLDYPVQALNWHDCHQYPTVRQARALTDKCIIGGLDEEGSIAYGKPMDVIEEVAEFLSQTNTRGVMVGPGCVTIPHPPAENVTAVRLVVERFGEKDTWKYLSMDSAQL